MDLPPRVAEGTLFLRFNLSLVSRRYIRFIPSLSPSPASQVQRGIMKPGLEFLRETRTSDLFSSIFFIRKEKCVISYKLRDEYIQVTMRVFVVDLGVTESD